MSDSLFKKKENIQMLWDVISDEEVFKFLSPDIQSKIYNLFINNIQGFFELEKTKTPNSLVEMNKKYILLILNHIRNTYSYQPSKIKIHNDAQVKELITYEEIHNDRKSQFDKDFTRKQEEFEDFMVLKTPPVPEFADPICKTDKPIKEMDKILKDMQAQRKYEVELINKSYNTNMNDTQIDNWLKPQETSLKSEKFPEIKSEESSNNSRFKFLNELETNLSNMNTNPKKNVSFNNNDQVNTFISEPVSEDEEVSLFSKLKRVHKKDDIKDDNKYDKNDDKKNDNITIQFQERTFNDEDRLAKLERKVENLNEKMDKILALLSNK